MRIRPVHIWWVGVALFGPSVLIWAASLSFFIYAGWFDFVLDWHSIVGIHLPLLAAILGLAVPVACLRYLRGASAKLSLSLFTAYLAIMLIWGVIDVRQENYQMGGHRYPHGVLVDGHRYYFHVYYTWYFLPYKWIERGVKNPSARAVGAGSAKGDPIFQSSIAGWPVVAER